MLPDDSLDGPPESGLSCVFRWRKSSFFAEVSGQKVKGFLGFRVKGKRVLERTEGFSSARGPLPITLFWSLEKGVLLPQVSFYQLTAKVHVIRRMTPLVGCGAPFDGAWNRSGKIFLRDADRVISSIGRVVL